MSAATRATKPPHRRSDRDFVFENNWLTHIYGFANQHPSKEFFRAADENDLLNIFRNTIVVGGLLMYAGAYARDKRLSFTARNSLE